MLITLTRTQNTLTDVEVVQTRTITLFMNVA